MDATTLALIEQIHTYEQGLSDAPAVDRDSLRHLLVAALDLTDRIQAELNPSAYTPEV
jgi:hypothetical protein